MPTYYIGRFKVRFYSNDHPPAHVHCINEDGTVIVDVATGAVRARKGGVKAQDVVRAVNLVEEHRELLLAKWEAFDKRRRRQS
jgi:hypothetical protein